MTIRVFLSYQHEDQLEAQRFNLSHVSDNTDVEFVGRHLLNAGDGGDSSYIAQKVRDQLDDTLATVVIFGERTGEQTGGSDWVDREISLSLEKGNTLVGVRLSPGVEVPDALVETGTEILDWFDDGDRQQLVSAIERAAQTGGRTRQATRTLGSRLREAREYLGFSQSDVADHLSVPRSAITKMELGDRKVSAEELAALARLYRRPYGYFVSDATEGHRTLDSDDETTQALFRAARNLTDEDRQQVLRFAEFLRNAGPPPVPDDEGL